MNSALKKLVIAAMMVVTSGAMAQEVVEAWDCGACLTFDCAEFDPVFCTFYDDGTFVVSGEGVMADYSRFGHFPPPFTNVPWHYFSESITSVIIEDGVTSIGDHTFYSISNITSVTISNSVTSIGNGAFFGCTPLTSITIPSSVTSIGKSAFSYCTALTSITIPSSVTSIGANAFSSCHALTSITIPSSVTSIGGHAFSYCPALTSITIPDGITSIGYGTFSGCASLTSITIPNSVTSIGYAAFIRCAALTSITIPDGVTSIESSTFEGCTSLTSITIPDGVTSIEEWAFRNSGLTSITIPAGVTNIGYAAFENCSTLTSIVALNSTPPANGIDEVGRTNVFRNISASACLYVPEESIDAYSTVAEWSDFKCIKSLDEYVSVKPTDRTNAPRIAFPRVTVRNRTLTVNPSSHGTAARVRLIDLRGKSVARFTADRPASFSLANLPAGRYFVEVREGMKRERVSVIVGF